MKKYRRQSFIPRSTSSEATMSCDEEERGGNSRAARWPVTQAVCKGGHTMPRISPVVYWQHIGAFNPYANPAEQAHA